MYQPYSTWMPALHHASSREESVHLERRDNHTAEAEPASYSYLVVVSIVVMASCEGARDDGRGVGRGARDEGRRRCEEPTPREGESSFYYYRAV